MSFDLETGTHCCPLPLKERRERKKVMVSHPARLFMPENYEI
jgi:hypothetical protein